MLMSKEWESKPAFKEAGVSVDVFCDGRALALVDGTLQPDGCGRHFTYPQIRDGMTLDREEKARHQMSNFTQTSTVKRAGIDAVLKDGGVYSYSASACEDPDLSWR